MKRILDAFWFCIAVIIIAIISFITIGACAMLVPVRWLIESRKGTRCVDCADRDEQYEILYRRTGRFE